MNMRGEAFNHSADQLRQLMQRWDNRLAFEGLALAEAYADGRIAVVLYASFDEPAKARGDLIDVAVGPFDL